MQTDQGQEATSREDTLPEGWGFGTNSIKPHYFPAGWVSSLCGKATSNNPRRLKRVAFPNDCVQCKEKYADRARVAAHEVEGLRVTKLIEHSTDAVWRYDARQAGRGYACEINARTALDQPAARWWAERGNPGMAKHEAERWAEAQVRAMADAAFAHDDLAAAGGP